MQGLLVVYALIAMAALVEENWPRALYWVSAIGITTAVLWGTR